MKRLLVLISIFCALVSQSATAQTDYPLLLAGSDHARWNFTLERGTLSLTGICLVRQTEEGLAGSVVNEFGIRAFDFTCRHDKVRVMNVLPQMNRWYIRRLLRADLRLLAASKAITPGRRRQLTTYLPDSLLLSNLKYHINYRFERIKE